MTVRIECFGPAARWCGASQLSIELEEGARVKDALDWLEVHYPEFAARRASIAVAVDDAIVAVSSELKPDSRVALIPPVSGG